MYNAGITTYVIGFGDGLNNQDAITQLQNMADWGSGGAEDYYDANNQVDLEEALGTILGALEFDPCCAINACTVHPEPSSDDEPDPVMATETVMATTKPQATATAKAAAEMETATAVATETAMATGQGARTRLMTRENLGLIRRARSTIVAATAEPSATSQAAVCSVLACSSACWASCADALARAAPAVAGKRKVRGKALTCDAGLLCLLRRRRGPTLEQVGHAQLGDRVQCSAVEVTSSELDDVQMWSSNRAIPPSKLARRSSASRSASASTCSVDACSDQCSRD